MNHHYRDIRSRIAEPPVWFDECAVPRWCPFHPREAADIYAREVALLAIECQSCGYPFVAAVSHSDDGLRAIPPLSERIADRTIHYGDPPNVECCPAGPTMNCIDRRVLEYWRLEKHEWVRDYEYEVEIESDERGEG